MSMASPLEDVVTKGTEHYYEGKSFRRWSLTMVHQYGPGVTPYLEDAWKIIEQNVRQIAEATKSAKPSFPDSVRQSPEAVPADIIQHGARSYEKGISFKRWSDRMIINNGERVSPYLRETWKSVTGKKDNMHLFTIMKNMNWKTFAAGLGCGVVFGFGVFFLFNHGFGSGQRFSLVSGGNGVAYKMDTRTGQIWSLIPHRAELLETPGSR
jgi:hypothetical protein